MRPLYVETLVRADLDALWRASQDPSQHQRWDARFTRITYRYSRTFDYATRVLPGLTVAGVGFSAGERHRPDGTCTSALRFASDDPRSLIRLGSGYWRYLPGPDGVRFLTGYDYQVRWGLAGRAADLVFRPLFGWATAWSFDRLRIWLEHGVPPERARRNALSEVAARSALVALTLLTGSVWLVVTAAVLAVAVPPDPHTPAARRCRRRARDLRTPAILTQVEGH